MRALVLNASYEPLGVVSAQRALSLVLADKAEMVLEADSVFHSQRHVFAVPSIVRLRRFVKVPYKRSVILTRKTVLARDKGVCCYCGGEATTVDHVQPRAKGGRHVWENVVASCSPCNHKKGQRLLKDLGWTMRYKPFRPHGVGAWLLTVRTDPAWEDFLAA